MIGLIKSEILKLSRRPILYVAFALIIVSVVLFTVLTLYSQYQEAKYEKQVNELKQNVETCNNLYLVAQTDEEKEKAKFDLDVAQFVFDKNITRDDFRNDLISKYFELKDKTDEESVKEYQKLKNYIENNDWKAYIRDKKAETEEKMSHLDINKDVDKYQYELYKIKIECYDLSLKYGISPSGSSPRTTNLNNYESGKEDLLDNEYHQNENKNILTADDILKLKKSTREMLYRVEHDIPQLYYNDEATFSQNAAVLNILIILMMIVIGTTILTSEFSYNTVGQLMSYPNRRYKILFAKLAVIIGTTILMQAVLYVATIIAAYLVEPTGANTARVLLVTDNNIFDFSFNFYLILKYFCYFIKLIFYFSMVFFLAILSKNAAVTIGVMIPVLFLSVPILEFIQDKIPDMSLWFVPFYTCDFNSFLDMKKLMSGYNFPGAVGITAATTAIFTFFGFRRFKRINI